MGNAGQIIWHMGLPCGTCSRAREIQLGHGEHGPRPLRDGDHLFGFPWNSESDKIKVDAANQLYEKAFSFALKLLKDGATFTIENPTGSWIWELPFVKPLYSSCFFVDLHACMFDSTSRKRTSILTDDKCFVKLRRFCDYSHDHEKWGIDERGNFNTAKEAQYPRAFCVEYATALQQIVQHTLTQQPVSHERCDQVDGDISDEQVSFIDFIDPTCLRPFHQPRGRKVPQLIPEFFRVVSKVLTSVPPTDHKRLTLYACYDVPVKSKLLRTEAQQGGILCIFGIFRSPEQFVQMSRSLKHPFDDLIHVPDMLLKCVFDILILGPVEIDNKTYSHAAGMETLVFGIGENRD